MLRMPVWHREFLRPAQFKSARGGRSSTKTWTAAALLVADAHREPRHDLYCVREFQKSIDYSAKPALEESIRRMDLADCFDMQEQKIVCTCKCYDPDHREHAVDPNGSRFHFQGLERRKESIKGMENAWRTWSEEAQRMSVESANLLLPTIFRVPGAQFWATWNPVNRTDWIWDWFVKKLRPEFVSVLVNYKGPYTVWHGTGPPRVVASDNTWCLTPEELMLADAMKVDNPDLYLHYWMGQPDDGSSEKKVLSYRMLIECVQAYREGLHEASDASVRDMGLDIADGGEDKNAIVHRRGPLLDYAHQWPSDTPGYLAPTARKAHSYAVEHDTWRIHFDVTGVGSGIRGDFLNLSGGIYNLEPVNFGGKVGGPDKRFEKGKTNQEVFAKRNAQMAWNLRQRAQRTIRLLRGDQTILPSQCLIINPGAIGNIDELLADLSQPQWRQNPTTGKIEIDKRGDLEKSPDLYDATALAFARDSKRGLRALV